MGKFTTIKTDHGVSIVSNDTSIHVIVRHITGRGRNREADLEIRGIDDVKTLHLKASDGVYRLNDEIHIGIRQVSPGEGKRVPMHIRAPAKYRIKDRKYALPNPSLPDASM